jgi:hypothetical protein
VTLGESILLNVRELRPKDYYFFSLINNDFPDITQNHFVLLIICRLAGLCEEDLGMIPAKFVKPLSEWLGPNVLNDRVMTVEQWLEMAFHLCKQRWDSSVEWLEQQPVSKILLMAKLQSDFASKQNEEMKRASRKKK